MRHLGRFGLAAVLALMAAGTIRIHVAEDHRPAPRCFGAELLLSDADSRSRCVQPWRLRA